MPCAATILSSNATARSAPSSSGRKGGMLAIITPGLLAIIPIAPL
jgi:hypothetical protein